MHIIEKIKPELPKDAMISDISYEGSEIILYTKNKEFFRNNIALIKRIVNKIKKRIEVRADPGIVKAEAFTEELIRKLVPKEAGIKDIYFEPEFAKVVVHASKPGLVIGHGGKTLSDIKSQTLWTPEIKRAPVIDSDVIRSIRKMLHKEAGYRKKFLNQLGEKIYTEEKKSVDYIRMMTMGGFREVGRSCIVFQTPESNTMVDCGISVKKDSNPYPHLDMPEFKIQDLDAVIVSHAHMDHSGMVPFLYKFGFRGPLYCTAPTRDTMTMLLLDFLKINKREGTKPPYQSKDIEEMLKHCITLGYGEVSDITPDMRLTLSNAGHLLGSSTVHLHVGDGLHNILYTSDMKYAPTKLFDPATTDFTRVETLIIESTYGTVITPSHKEAEQFLISKIRDTISRGGKVLIPAFAVGRSQDVVATIAETDINVPIYLDGMIWDATAIHTAYPEFMSKEMQMKILHKGKNPFVDPRIRGVGSGEERKNVIEEKDPSIIISTSGMMVGGPIMEYLKQLSDNPKNMLLFVGYQGEGTMGRRIQKGWKMVNVENARNGGASVGKGLELKLQIETVSGLGGHADQNELLSFIEHLKTKPKRIITDHGESRKCVGASRLYHQTFHTRTQAPSNMEIIRIR